MGKLLRETEFPVKRDSYIIIESLNSTRAVRQINKTNTIINGGKFPVWNE